MTSNRPGSSGASGGGPGAAEGDRSESHRRPRGAFSRCRGPLLLAAAPPFVLAILIYAWGVDLPYWDEWSMVPLHGKLREGTLTFGDLWRQHNEHRMFFPRLSMLALGLLTGWNVRWELAVNFLLALAIFLMALRLFRRTRGSAAREAPPALVAGWVSLLVFSPSQWMNWTWGMQLSIFLNVAAVLGGLLLLARRDRRRRHLALAAGCGFVATFSFASGILFWPVALPLVLKPPGRRPARCLAWLLVSSATLALYLHGFQWDIGRSPPAVDWHRLKLYGGYVAIHLGSPLFSYEGQLAMYGGFLALVAFALIVARHALCRPAELVSAMAPLSITAYAILDALLIGAGRFDFGIGQALDSRYVTLSNLFWLGFGALLWSFHRDAAGGADGRRRKAGPAVALASLLLMPGYGTGAAHLRQQYEVRRSIRDDLRRGDLDTDLTAIFPDPRIVRERLPILREHRLSLYRGYREPAPSP